jgi:uncharacterized protein
MILLDTNVWVYAVNRQASQHRMAVAVLNDAFSAPGQAGLAWISAVGFLRLTTMRGVMSPPLQIGEALEILRTWRGHAGLRIVEPGPRHGELLERTLLAAGRGGNLVNDAHLAALALEHQATLVSFDRDFERFPGLRLEWLGS